MITNEELTNALQNMVTNSLGDRVILDQSAIRIMVLAKEVEELQRKVEQYESV